MGIDNGGLHLEGVPVEVESGSLDVLTRRVSPVEKSDGGASLVTSHALAANIIEDKIGDSSEKVEAELVDSKSAINFVD